MKKLAIATIALIGTPAFAADMAIKMPVKAPPPTPAPTFSWTGFYAGVELGAKWANTTWTTTSLSTGGPNPIDASSPRNYDPSGFRYGGYVGYNWQFAPQWLLGVEADLAGANDTVTAVGIPGCTIGCPPFLGEEALDSSLVKMGWDASVRARLGYLVTPDLLAYATGGVAWQRVEASATCQHSNPDPFCFGDPGNPFATGTNSAVLTGWTVGGGLEYRVFGNWLLRGEYRYSNFGTWSGNVLNLGVPGDPATVTHNLKVNTQIATGGIAYKF